MRIRRLLRYSLRTMFVVVLVLSVWLGYMANKTAKQRRAVALVSELRGSVFFDVQRPTFRADHGIVSYRLLRKGPSSRLMELDWLRSVEIVMLVGPDVTDEKLAELADGLPSIEGLFLAECPITDVGLGHLYSLTNLRQLGIHGTKATREGIALIRRQRPDLEVVYVP